MARTAKDGISKHPRHGYRVTLGRKLDGKPRLFWLGKRRATAEYAAHCYRGQFEGMKDEGRLVWTEADVGAVQSAVAEFGKVIAALHRRHLLDTQQAAATVTQVGARGAYLADVFSGTFPAAPAAVSQPVPSTTPEPTPAAAPRVATLYGVIQAYLDALDRKPFSPSHKARARQVLDGLKRVRSDLPLAEVDAAWIERIGDHYRTRPASERGKGQISGTTAATTLRYLRAFLSWADATGCGGWAAPRQMSKLLTASATDLMTPGELRAAATIPQFDVPTLAKLYRAAGGRGRCWMLTALFTGATQQELAMMEKAAFDLDASELRHWRNKSKVEGRHWLPPELIALLRAEFARLPDDPHAFLADDGGPLVDYRGKVKTRDVVAEAWDSLREAAGLRDALSFKFLRKFAADYATRHGGEEVGQVAVSYARRSVLGRDYTSSQPRDKLHEAQRALHAELVTENMFCDDDSNN